MFEGHRLENVDIFYGHLEYFEYIWGILWPFGKLCIDLVHFSGFGITHQQKSGNPVLARFNAWSAVQWQPPFFQRGVSEFHDNVSFFYPLFLWNSSATHFSAIRHKLYL
jgi:hypothetical protein